MTLKWISLVCLYAVLVSNKAQDNIVYNCPAGWVTKGISCYRLYGVADTEKQTWENALRICQGTGAQLVTIKDFYENEEIGDFVKQQSSTTQSAWLGMNRKGIDDTNINDARWNEVTGAYSGSRYEGRWADNSPDVANGDCASLTIMGNDYKWKFGRCEQKMAFVCERKSCPTGSFFCNNGGCVSNKWKCDGEDDCGDYSDEIECPNNCRTVLTISSGTIRSNNYPNAYTPSSVCLWTIMAKEGTNVLLEIENFNTEKNSDVVDILVGGKTEATATAVAKLSGTITGTRRYRSYNNYLIVRFITDSITEKSGFSMKFSSLDDNTPSSISLTAKNTSSTLVPPVYNAAVGTAYLGSQDYVWILTAQHTKRVVTIERMMINLYDGDFINIHDGDSAMGSMLTSYSSANNDNVKVNPSSNMPSTGPRFISSTGRQMYIILRTDRTTSGSGFTFNYWQGCETTLTSETGEIFSPGYKGSINYANYQMCTWTVNLPSGKGITLFFENGAVVEDNKDLLEIYRNSTDDSGIPVHSGQGFVSSTFANIPVIHSDNGKMYFKFNTDSVTNRQGFYGVYSVDCPDPNFNEYTDISGPQNWRYRDQITVSCKQGYSFSAEMFSSSSLTLTCQFGGIWSDTIPRCQAVYCGLPPVVTNGYYYNSTGVVYDTEVRYECYPGFNMMGTEIVTCLSNNQWTNPPTCQGAVCAQLPNIANGQRMIESGDLTSYASIIKYECNGGYELDGEPILFCQSNNQWSASVPSCNKLRCPLPDIMHGQLSRTTFPEYEDQMTVSCDGGYVINGTSQLTCQADQGFGDLPWCQNVDECALGTSGCAHNCHDNDGSYTCSCNNGYTLNNDGRTCGDILECNMQNNAGCDQVCTDNPGGYQCDCKTGYQLYTADGTANFSLVPPENGQQEGDVYYIDHTCVRKLCQDPPSITNGMMLTRRRNHNFGDTVEYDCNLGYINVGNSLLTCDSNGQWSPQGTPSCQAVTCPVEPYQTFGLIRNPDTVDPVSTVGFGDMLNISCKVPGKADFTKERKCIFNITTDTYHLYGNDYECGEINCGSPETIPGANFLTPSNSVYGSKFTFSCSNLYSIDGKSNNGATDTEVNCGADGLWDLGNLQCVGATCSDPGYPVGGSITVNGFELNGYVTFQCDRSGFAPSRETGIGCVLNSLGSALRWNDSVPLCLDVTKPTMTNCPSDMTVNVYSRPSFSSPTVTDNSGAIESFTVQPANANTSMVIRRNNNQTVTYRARDIAGNEETCSFVIAERDEEPPVIQSCPLSRIEYVTAEGETREITTVNPNTINVQDNRNIASITIDPPTFIARASSLGKQLVTVTAYDSAGNSDRCSFEIVVRASTCSPYTVPTPIHGSKTCEVKTGNTGYSCNITCNNGYYLHGYPDESIKTMECDTNGGWNIPIIPACIIANVQAQYSQIFDVRYNANQNIPDSCKDNYRGIIQSLLPETGSRLSATCNAAGQSSLSVGITKDDSSFAINSNEMAVRFFVTIGPDGLSTQSYQTCGDFNEISFTSVALPIRSITGASGCPDLTLTWNNPGSSFQEGFLCTNNRKLAVIGSVSYCLACPEGTYTTGPGTCALCPAGTYNENTGRTTCADCSAGTSTVTEGNVYQSSCSAQCPPGYKSSSGMPPCDQCPRNTYSDGNSTACTDCQSNTITYRPGSTSQTQCYGKCPQGQFSYNGYAPNCRTCPRNFYQPNTGATDCIECAADKITLSDGNNDVSACVDAGPQLCITNRCQNGGTCQIINHDYTCRCAQGFYGRNCERSVNYCLSQPCYNNGGCSSTSSGFSCSCPAGTTGSRCETDLNTECQADTCKNGGVCLNRVNSFQCVCPATYTGTTCTGQSNICQQEPCLNNGVCVNYGNVRRKCECIAGFTGKSCEINILECDSNPCYNDATCEDRVNGYICRCKPGYSGSRCDIRASPCVDCNGGTCVDDYRNDNHRCVCNEGRSYGDSCGYELHVATIPSLTGAQVQDFNDVSECFTRCGSNRDNCLGFAYNPTLKKCHIFYNTLPMETSSDNEYNFYIKRCIRPVDDFYSPWYNIDSPGNGDDERRSQLEQYGIQVCGGTDPVGAECRVFNQSLTTPDETGDRINVDCGINGLQCQNLNNNPCQDYEVRYRCSAFQVFRGKTCVALNYCAFYDNPCQNNGQCSSTPTGYSCNCQTGFTGSMCQHNINDCPTQNQCLNGGTCKDGINTYTCDCQPGYSGQICQTNNNDCSPYPCEPIGSQSCQDLVNDFSCVCFDGYTGKNCSINIDECASDPCLHGGTCSDGVNGFRCDCPDGWIGQRCELVMEKCQLDLCQSNSNCSNLFNDYYCHCPDNHYGKNCENAPDICRDVNPCLNSGQCVYGVPPTCSCNSNYLGTGCETLKDHCAVSDQCKNGGTCQAGANGIGFQCQCQPGYGGNNCEININNCAGVSCPAASTCVDVVNAHYCRCNLGLTGENCDRTLNTNYDYFFYLPTRNGYAALPYPIQLSGTSFTIHMWVRFYESGADETYFTMYSVDAINNLENPKPIVEFVSNGVNVYDQNGAMSFIQQKSYAQVDDGKWHNVVFVWSNNGGGQFIMDDVRQGTEAQIYNGFTFNHQVWIVLGGKLDTSTKQPMVNKGFRGYVSQVNIYNRALAFTTEIPEITANPQITFVGSILRWNEFVLYKGVQPVYPSRASRDGCTVGTSCVKKDKTPPSTTNCPSDIYVYSKERFTTVEWTEPTFQGATTVKRKYRPGETFLWGRYQMTYEAIDDESNSAFCNFNIYVQSDTCQQPLDPWGGDQTCSNTYAPYFGCSIGCTDNNERISRLHPNLYTCGPSGSWNPRDSKRFIPLRYPPCGPIQGDVKMNLVVFISYPLISTTNCDGVKATLTAESLIKIQGINTVWGSQLCSVNNCNDVTIVVSCGGSSGRRKRAISATSVEITIPKSAAQLTSSGETLSAEEVMRRSVLETNLFDFSDNVPSAKLDSNGFTITTSSTCQDTETDINGKCVKCGPGTYWDSTTKICVDCPIGTYSNQDGQTQCTACTTGLTTETTGAYSPNMCYSSCTAGKFYNTTSSQCEDCSVGYYQQKTGQFYCNWCGLGQTTRNPASTSPSSCYDECPNGQELSQNGNCVPCPIGTFRTSGVHALCISCPTGSITLSTGSAVQGDCNIKACEAGYKRVGTSTCEKCPVGTYQPQKWQTTCLSCGGDRYTTDQEASTDVSECKFFCESGFQNNSLTCERCPVGYYKDNSVNKYSQCVQCPLNKKTPATGSTSENDCSIFSCLAGYKSNSAGTQCERCPVGTYQPQPDMTSCTDCPQGTSTEQDAATSRNLCLNICPEGKERQDDGSCTDCIIGFYKNNNPNPFMNCTECPQDYVTSGPGSTQATQCTVRKCLAGTYIGSNNAGCIDCARGTYQNLLYQSSCTPCPGNTNTRTTKATSVSQCETFCSSGSQKLASGNCEVCERGYYKDNNNDVFDDCTLCPADRITPSTGSSSAADCSVGNCTAGYKINGAGCTICPVGSYQENKWESTCNTCPPQKTTTTSGATSLADCILSCDPGYEDDGSGACKKCAIGYYKPEKKAASCTKCPTGSITAGNGSTQSSDCNVPDCQAGYKFVNNRCEECGYDNYQPLKQQPSCIPCGAGKTTFSSKTAVAESECRVDCGNGQEINPAYASNPNADSCIRCERGYYRNGADRSMTVCQMCPIDFITSEGQLATTASDCSIRNCTTPGEYRDTASNQCRPCSKGFYSNQKWQDVCQACLAGYTTTNTGSTSQTDCILDCPSGQEAGGSQCGVCPKGKYRNKATDGLQCKDCPAGRTTITTGTTSSSGCTLSTCNVGEKLDTNSGQCVKCSVDYYQDQAGQDNCIVCPDGKYTDNDGSISLTACKSRCDNSNKNNCTANTDCTDDVTKGFVCSCKANHILQNNLCTHQCDTGYCLRGTCIRDPVSCACPDEYTGNRCETRKSSTGLSSTEKIIAGSVSGGVALLIIIVIIVCCCTWLMRAKPSPKTSRYREPSYLDDKTSLFNNTMPRSIAPQYYDYGGSTPRMLTYRDPSPASYGQRSMRQYPEITYDNAAFNGDPAVYKSNA